MYVVFNHFNIYLIIFLIILLQTGSHNLCVFILHLDGHSHTLHNIQGEGSLCSGQGEIWQHQQGLGSQLLC